MVVDSGVIKKVHGFPAASWLDTVRRHNGVQVIGAVGVTEVSLVLVIFGRTGQAESIMTPAGVLNHLDKGLHVPVIIF